jgi:hypothetical protein
MHALRGYGQAERTYDNKAYTFSSTYHDGTLKMYAHHPAQPSHPGASPRYYMTKSRRLGVNQIVGEYRRRDHTHGAWSELGNTFYETTL